MTGIGINPQCCCNAATGYYQQTVIGFDELAWTALENIYADYDPSILIAENLATDLTDLNQVSLLFAGLAPSSCGDPINFGSSDWSTIGDWISAGGRLWLNTEHDSFPCIDTTNLASFISAIGGSISYLTGYGLDPLCNSTRYCSVGAAGIASGITDFNIALSGRLSGGTTVFLSNSTPHYPVVSVEAIGNGFFFLSGDSDIWGGSCAYMAGNVTLAHRLLSFGDGSVI